jgi:hypothetical protein
MTRATRAQADEKRTVPPSAPLFVFDCSPLKPSRGTGLVKRTIGPTRSQKISSALCAPGAETLNIVALVIARRASPAAHTAAWRTVPPAWDAPPTSWMETYSAGAGCGAASRSGLESNRSGPETKWPPQKRRWRRTPRYGRGWGTRKVFPNRPSARVLALALGSRPERADRTDDGHAAQPEAGLSCIPEHGGRILDLFQALPMDWIFC